MVIRLAMWLRLIFVFSKSDKDTALTAQLIEPLLGGVIAGVGVIALVLT
jgi:hypothetical protein